MRKRILSVILCICMFLSCGSICAKAQEEPFHVNADAAILMDADTGEVLYQQNANKQLFIASLTKLMSLILVAQEIDSGKVHLNDIVTVGKNALSQPEGSNIGFLIGTKLTVEDLIKSIFLESGCDACIALCEHIAGSEKAFVKRMNQQAALMGLENTAFENCTGVDIEVLNHYSSARDVALMSLEVMQHPAIVKYATAVEDTVCNGTIALKNSNKLVNSYPDCMGLKTGTTSRAGFCLSAVATREGATVCAVVLGANNATERFAQTKALLDYGLNGKEMHDFQNKFLRQAGCTTNGEAVRTCRNCAFSYTQILTKKGHDWGEWEMLCAPSCTTLGSRTRVCTRNPAHRQTETLPALEHDWDDWTVTTPPGCTKEGVQTRVCRRDTSHTESKSVAALGHEVRTKHVVPPTATAAGYTVHTCPRCEDSFTDTYIAPIGKVKTFTCKKREANRQTLTWSRVSGAAGYQIECTPVGKAWRTVADNTAKTSIALQNLRAGTAYKMRIRFCVDTPEGKLFGAWKAITSPTLPEGTSLTNVTGAAKAFTAKWKCNKTANGYRIQYSTKANFSNAKTVTIRSGKTLKATVKRLHPGKTYYVRVQTYKTIVKVKYFSAWSKVAIVTTK